MIHKKPEAKLWAFKFVEKCSYIIKLKVVKGLTKVGPFLVQITIRRLKKSTCTAALPFAARNATSPSSPLLPAYNRNVIALCGNLCSALPHTRIERNSNKQCAWQPLFCGCHNLRKRSKPIVTKFRTFEQLKTYLKSRAFPVLDRKAVRGYVHH